jgi:hypothetical protein
MRKVAYLIDHPILDRIRSYPLETDLRDYLLAIIIALIYST